MSHAYNLAKTSMTKDLKIVTSCSIKDVNNVMARKKQQQRKTCTCLLAPTIKIHQIMVLTSNKKYVLPVSLLLSPIS